VDGAVTINPIVAPIGSRPGDPWAGIWLAEDVEAIRQGVTGGSWIDSTLGGVGAGLDTLAAVSDPLGTLMQYGLSWLMEHIRPLSEALDWLAGDPALIAAHAQTWRNVATSLRSDVATFGQGAGTGVSGWQGVAATAYQTWASHQQTVLGGLATAADTMASISDGVAYLIAGVRVMVRDAIATVVSRTIDYAGEEFFSFGLATPWVIEQVSTLVASWSARIGRWMTALRDSVGRLTSTMSRLGEIIEALKKLLRDDRGSIGGGDPIRPPGHEPPTSVKPHPGMEPLSQAEEATGVRLMAMPGYTGGQLSQSPHIASDFVDERGVTYDAIGQPAAYRYWSPGQFFDSLDRHIYYPKGEYTVLDLTGTTSGQRTEILSYTSSTYSDAERAKLIVLGE
jgi:hypothetical protein